MIHPVTSIDLISRVT